VSNHRSAQIKVPIILFCLLASVQSALAIDLLQIDHTPPSVTSSDIAAGTISVSISSDGLKRARVLYFSREQPLFLEMIKEGGRFKAALPLDTTANELGTSIIRYSFQVERIRGGLATSKGFRFHGSDTSSSKGTNIISALQQVEQLYAQRIAILETVEVILGNESLTDNEKVKQISIARVKLQAIDRSSRSSFNSKNLRVQK